MLEVFGWNRDPFEILRIKPNFYYWYPYTELETRIVLNLHRYDPIILRNIHT